MFKIFSTHICWINIFILFTSYTNSVSCTNSHYTVFDVYIAHKKSSFLVIGVPFSLHGVLAAFLCTSLASPLINFILFSSVEVADGTSFHFKLIGGFWLVKRFVILCSMILAIFSLPEQFMSSPCNVNSFLVRLMSVILTCCISCRNLCSFLLKTCISLFTKRGIVKVIPVWRCYCNDICRFISQCKFPNVSETSVGFIYVDVICTSLPCDYQVIMV